MNSIRVISTGDGSHSLMREDIQETYHSVHGALRESTHVFIQHGLIHFQNQYPGKPVRVLEVGFGTGLNALLSFHHARQTGLSIHFESWEKYPLPAGLVFSLNYGELLGEAALFKALHEATWNEEVSIQPTCTLCKKEGNVLSDPMTGLFDLVFYDAFAPSKQPEMWTVEVLKKITDMLTAGGAWVSYCAKGQVKRDLAALGLVVESLPGPPGKKEMTRASRPIGIE